MRREIVLGLVARDAEDARDGKERYGEPVDEQLVIALQAPEIGTGVHAPFYPTDKRLFQEDRKPCLRLSLHYMFYNFCRIHKTLRVTPAMAAKVTDRLWSVEDIVQVIDDWEAIRQAA